MSRCIALVTAKRECLAASTKEQVLFAIAKELLQRQLKARISKEAVIACAEADEAMDKLQAAILRVEQLQSN